ncbi:hypothetical protein SAMN04489860_0107 [Paraoerskovia marina]|uniref:Alpha/beta hydrolase family protein n=1 Tax=Paraoerskovia marina TaxID=545619 RepID=A0A1H1M170_9CELL|nr:hypothetical protein [Paraoerskovia marina]SDR80598.1 hypothetical protein SAMN04489860_0107 [Paraoerskovia marina]
MSDLLVDTCRIRSDADRVRDLAATVDGMVAPLVTAAVSLRSTPWGGLGAWDEPFLAVRAAQVAGEVEAATGLVRLLAGDLAALAGDADAAAGEFEAADAGLAVDLRSVMVWTAPVHEPFVGSLALTVAGPHVPGLPGGLAALFGAGGSVGGAVGSVADSLARLTGLRRRAYADDPRVEVVERDVLPAPRTAVEALHGVQRVSEEQHGASLVAVQELRAAGGSSRWLVSVPGTNTYSASTFGWHQNFELMSADAAERESADSVVVIREAMDRAGVGPQDDVMLVGHSQGGLAAAVVAASDPRVTRLVTAGSPVAGHRLPERVRSLHVEVPGEIVTALDGRRNPATPGRVTVGGAADLTVGAASDVIPHGVGYHAAALEAALADRRRDDETSAALRTVDAEIEDFLDAELVGQAVIESRLVPEQHPVEPTDEPRDPPREPGTAP